MKTYPCPEITYRDKVLYIEKVSTLDLVEEFGTPLMCFSKKRLINNAEILSGSLKRNHKKTKVFYAYKANYLSPILHLFKAEGLGAEIISMFEIMMAETVGIAHEDIIFNGPGKTYEALVYAIKNNILLNADSFSELEKINRISKAHKTITDIGIRVHLRNNKINRKNLFVPQGSKLGFDIKDEDIYTFLKKIRKYEHLRIIGFHAHLYSRCRSTKLYVDLVNSLYKLCEIAEKIGMEIEFINIGGGFDSRYLIERETSCDNFFRDISLTLNELRNNLWLYVEPGRYLVNDAGICLTKIITKKINMGNLWGIVDIGSNFLVPTKNAYFEAIPINKNRSLPEEKINIADGICSTTGTICEDLKIPRIKEGDILAILNCGGYTINLSSNFVYFRPTIVLVDRYKIKILKQSKNFGEAKYVF